MKVVRKENAPRYQRDGITSYLLIAESTTYAKNATVTLVEMKAGGKQHIHAHETEQCYLIFQGRGQMTVGDETVEVSAGDNIFIPSNSPHGLQNSDNDVLKYISAGSPVFGNEQEKELWPLPSMSS
ncbi:MAG: cupin domain-containing protein [Planctomycetota bacterium]|jgi:mannose-6-phosphate isomerase-like protein (cupin superfamily)